MSVAAMEDTLIILKPDALERGLVSAVFDRFERAGLTIVGLKLLQPNVELIAEHYDEHVDKDFYPGLESLLLRGPSIGMVLRGYGAVAVCRKLRGNTDPATALPGTICGDFGHALLEAQNLVHASSDALSARREIALWFAPSEIVRLPTS